MTYAKEAMRETLREANKIQKIKNLNDQMIGEGAV